MIPYRATRVEVKATLETSGGERREAENLIRVTRRPRDEEAAPDALIQALLLDLTLQMIVDEPLDAIVSLRSENNATMLARSVKKCWPRKERRSKLW